MSMVLDFIENDNVQGLVNYYKGWVQTSKARQGKAKLTKKDIIYAHKEAKAEMPGLHDAIVAAGAVKVAVALYQICGSKHGVVNPEHIEREYDWCSSGKGKVGVWGRITGQKDFSGLLTVAAKKMKAPKDWAKDNLKKIKGDDADAKESIDESSLHEGNHEVVYSSVPTASDNDMKILSLAKDNPYNDNVDNLMRDALLKEIEDKSLDELAFFLGELISDGECGDGFEFFDACLSKVGFEVTTKVNSLGENIIQSIISAGDVKLYSHYINQHFQFHDLVKDEWVINQDLMQQALRHENSYGVTAKNYHLPDFAQTMHKKRESFPEEGYEQKAEDSLAKLAQQGIEARKELDVKGDTDFLGFDGVCDGISALSKAVAAGLPNLQAIGGRKGSLASSDGSFSTAFGEQVGDSDGAATSDGAVSSGDEGESVGSFENIFPTGDAGALHELSSAGGPPAAPKPVRKKLLKRSDAQSSLDSISSEDEGETSSALGKYQTLNDLSLGFEKGVAQSSEGEVSALGDGGSMLESHI